MFTYVDCQNHRSATCYSTSTAAAAAAAAATILIGISRCNGADILARMGKLNSVHWITYRKRQ